MDTELLVHLLARSGASELASALQHVAGRAIGAYSLTILCAGRLYGLRDAYGLRPLVLMAISTSPGEPSACTCLE